MMESTLARVTKVTNSNTKKWYEVYLLLVAEDILMKKKETATSYYGRTSESRIEAVTLGSEEGARCRISFYTQS